MGLSHQPVEVPLVRNDHGAGQGFNDFLIGP
jgi:hypothetical protein